MSRLKALKRCESFQSSREKLDQDTYTNSPSFSLVWIKAHDLWSWTATARRLLGEAPFDAPGIASGTSRLARIIGLEPLLREAMWRPPPIILRWNKHELLMRYHLHIRNLFVQRHKNHFNSRDLLKFKMELQLIKCRKFQCGNSLTTFQRSSRNEN